MSEEIRKFIDKVKNFNQFVNEQKLNEISSDTFKSAINVSKERDLIGRTEKLGSLYFKDFIGKPIFDDGIIENISIAAYKSDSRRLVALDLKYSNKNQTYYNDDTNYPKSRWINYDIDDDMWINIDWEINRSDARLLGKIAEKINPDTKYKETGKFFNIKGW
jgi:hypothetical protein